MRFSEAKGQKVLSTSTATTVGKVDGFVVDPDSRQVVALTLKKTEGDGDTLLWSALTAFGRDAVTVGSGDSVGRAEGRTALLADKDNAVLGKRVLTDTGDELGQVQDVDFDTATGSVVTLITKTHEVAGARLRGIGSYAVVVRAE